MQFITANQLWRSLSRDTENWLLYNFLPRVQYVKHSVHYNELNYSRHDACSSVEFFIYKRIKLQPDTGLS